MSVVINGSAGVTTNSGAVYNGIAAGTAVASTSGTSIDFTSIPSWVKRVTVMFNGVSLSGTSIIQVQLGYSGGVEATGYSGTATNLDSAIGGAANSTGFQLADASGASSASTGAAVITNISGNIWIFSYNGAQGSGAGQGAVSAGAKTTTGTLDRVRITTVNGTDTFDAGSINILYE